MCINIVTVQNVNTKTEHRFGDEAWEKLKTSGDYRKIKEEKHCPEGDIGTGAKYTFSGVQATSSSGCNC